MLMGMFAVKDKAADAFVPPFFLPNDSMALREFLYAAKMPDSKFAQHPMDFSLYKLGTFDDSNGSVKVLPEPVFMVSADGIFGPLYGKE